MEQPPSAVLGGDTGEGAGATRGLPAAEMDKPPGTAERLLGSLPSTAGCPACRSNGQGVILPSFGDVTWREGQGKVIDNVVGTT